MPLLKKKALEKAPLPEDLRDNEEVFHCEMTNEIFRDYEEFAERTILCNSMVWTCSMTGKSNLTYLEALQSEENAMKNLEDFPVQLRVPILYLADKTKRSNFSDMAEDVFCYIKDRYFIGEVIEACFSGNKWRDYYVVQVIGPSENEVKKAVKTNGASAEQQFSPHPSLYKYDLEQVETEDDDVVEKMMVDYTQIRRRKGTFSREKSKLFLKQYVEQKNNLWTVQESALKSFGVNRIKFSDIYDGPLPNFTSKKTKNVVNGKKVRQETLAKYLTKTNPNFFKNAKPPSEDELRKKIEEEEHKKELKQKQAEIRQKKRQEFNKITNIYKEWCKPKEDLELENQKKLPVLSEIKTKIPDEHVADMLMVTEFVNSFSKLLYKEDFFPNGFTFNILEHALTEKELAGPLIDLIQMLLNAIFALQEEESTHTNTGFKRPTVLTKISENPSLSDCVAYASAFATWPKRYHGTVVRNLPLYSLTVSEILRLHLLSSGAHIKENGAKWRFQQRGGYTNEDDPGLIMRWREPYLIKALSTRNVVEFTIKDKLKLISCLIDQLLTYADVRDLIEERRESSRQHKVDFKTAQFAEKQRYAEFNSNKRKLKLMTCREELDKIEKDNGKQLENYTEKINKITKACSEHQILLGFDRAFRRYIKLESIPGLFIDSSDTKAGTCLSMLVHQNQHLVNADKKELFDYFKSSSDEINTSDKENSPSELPKLNGINNSVMDEIKSCQELLMCSANPESCPVHSENSESYGIQFFSKKEELDDFISSLNKRGIRESELQQVLQNYNEHLVKLIDETPCSQLNSDVDSNTKASNYSTHKDANFGYESTTDTNFILRSVLTKNILEMETKISTGNLGFLKVKDRHSWRKCLTDGDYINFDRSIVRPVENGKVITENGEGSRESTPDNVKQNTYMDPAFTLGSSESDTTNVIFELSEEEKIALQCLSIALVQVAYAVDVKNLRKPLGHAGMSNADIRNTHIPCDILHQWELSLLSSTSYSQLFLHYGTLDGCIAWHRKSYMAQCHICRRRKEGEKVFCDNCRAGYHVKCVKPKLRSMPEGDWSCPKCVREKEMENKRLNPENEKQKRRKIFREDIDEEEEDTATDIAENIADKEAEVDDEECNETDEEMEEAKSDKCSLCGSDGDLLCCEHCSKCFHIECLQPPLRRKPRGLWSCNNCKEKRNNRNTDSDSNETPMQTRRVGRREAEDLPLHNAALQDLLLEVMKCDDAWPFLRPVQKNEVPDYYDVINKPMDFGTIKYKLNMGSYTCDEEFMADAVLIFENCNTYNNSDAEVYKCGVRLLQVFEKKSKELGLKLPAEMQDDVSENDWQPKTKKRREK